MKINMIHSAALIHCIFNRKMIYYKTRIPKNLEIQFCFDDVMYL